jgi:hypothetical protein
MKFCNSCRHVIGTRICLYCNSRNVQVVMGPRSRLRMDKRLKRKATRDARINRIGRFCD